MDRFDVVAHFAKRRMGVPIDWKRFFDVPPANADEWEHGVTGYLGHLSNEVRWFVSRHEDPGRVLADTEVDAITWRMFSALFDEDTVTERCMQNLNFWPETKCEGHPQSGTS